MAITLEQDDESHAHLYHTDDTDFIPQAVTRIDNLDRAIYAYMVQQRLDSYNIHTINQFNGFLDFLDNRQYEEALYRVSNIVDEANTARQAIEAGELGIGQGTEWASVESTSKNVPQKESMYKAINKNSKQIHKSTAKTENAMSDIDKKFSQVLQMQESLFSMFLGQKEQQDELVKRIDDIHFTISAKDFPQEATKQEKPPIS